MTAAQSSDPPATRRPAVAVIDDDTVIRLATLQLLEAAVTAAGGFADTAEFFAARPDADVVLLDLNLAGTGAATPVHGAAAIALVADAGYQVLIYTNERRRQVLAGCLAAGASGVIHKAEPIERLASAIQQVAEGQLVITTALAGLAEVIARHGELPTLTTRQSQILSRRARGEPFQQIASSLGISRRTTEEHMSEVSRKFASYLRRHSATDLERHLGLAPGDLLDTVPPERDRRL